MAIGQYQSFKKWMDENIPTKTSFGHLWDVHEGYRVLTHNNILLNGMEHTENIMLKVMRNKLSHRGRYEVVAKEHCHCQWSEMTQWQLMQLMQHVRCRQCDNVTSNVGIYPFMVVSFTKKKSTGCGWCYPINCSWHYPINCWLLGYWSCDLV